MKSAMCIILFAAVLNVGAGATVTITDIPEARMDVATHGPNAQLVNGSILTKAITALRGVSSRLPNDTVMTMASDGMQFEVTAPGSRASTLIDVQAGTARTVQDSTIATPAVTMNLGKMRSIDLVSRDLAALERKGLTDKDLGNYDVLVYPILNGPSTGSFFVGLIHHKPSDKKNTRIGCIDSFGGINAEFVVNPSNWTANRLSC